MNTIYTILGAIVFWLSLLFIFLMVAGIALEFIWRKYWPDGLLQFKNYHRDRPEYLRWKAGQIRRETMLKNAGVKIAKKRKPY
jgi:hypothetical protein